MAEDILLRMLTVKMKDINREAYILQVRVVLHMFCKIAIIVEKDVIWHLSIDSKGTLDEFLVLSRTVFSRTFSIVLQPSRDIPACSRPLSVCL